MYVTTVDQSINLCALGLNPVTSDFCYHRKGEGYSDTPDIIREGNCGKDDIRAWSTDALIEIAKNVCDRLEIRLTVTGLWNVFATVTFWDGENHKYYPEDGGSNYEEAIYKLILWLAENKHI